MLRFSLRRSAPAPGVPIVRSSPAGSRRPGFVIGELLIAVLLLAVAVSSLAALMYSVARHPSDRDQAECVVKKGAATPDKCSASVAVVSSAKLFRSGCVTAATDKSQAQPCKDSVVADSAEETLLRPRTDSASLAALEKKQKSARQRERLDRGFIR